MARCDRCGIVNGRDKWDLLADQRPYCDIEEQTRQPVVLVGDVRNKGVVGQTHVCLQVDHLLPVNVGL